MKWSLGMVVIFIFSLLAPPVMPIAEEEEKPMVVAQNHDNSGFDRPIEGDSEDCEPEDEDGDEFVLEVIPRKPTNAFLNMAADWPHEYKAPDLDRSLRPPRA